VFGIADSGQEQFGYVAHQRLDVEGTDRVVPAGDRMEGSEHHLMGRTDCQAPKLTGSNPFVQDAPQVGLVARSEFSGGVARQDQVQMMGQHLARGCCNPDFDVRGDKGSEPVRSAGIGRCELSSALFDSCDGLIEQGGEELLLAIDVVVKPCLRQAY